MKQWLYRIVEKSGYKHHWGAMEPRNFGRYIELFKTFPPIIKGEGKPYDDIKCVEWKAMFFKPLKGDING